MLVNDGLSMYAEQAVSDWNRDYVKDLFAKHKPGELHSSRTKPHAETAKLFYDIQIDVTRIQIRSTRYNTNKQQ